MKSYETKHGDNTKQENYIVLTKTIIYIIIDLTPL